MTDLRERYGAWALIAGASVGLGAEFARQLAAQKINLVLVARNAAALEALATELRAGGVEVRTLAIDLADAQLDARLEEATRGLEIGLVVYNAAHSRIGPFLDQPLDEQLRTIDVNCRGPLVVAHRFGRAMRARGRGGIVIMTSLAASQGSPMIATYAATKAFDLVLAESLWEELAGAGVDVLACRAGATRTPAYEASKPVAPTPMMEPAPVVRAALAALGRAPSVVPGGFNRFAAFLLNRMMPRRFAIRTMGRATRKVYGLGK
jgi:short-subunit dehydrogenase